MNTGNVGMNEGCDDSAFLRRVDRTVVYLLLELFLSAGSLVSHAGYAEIAFTVDRGCRFHNRFVFPGLCIWLLCDSSYVR